MKNFLIMSVCLILIGGSILVATLIHNLSANVEIEKLDPGTGSEVNIRR